MRKTPGSDGNTNPTHTLKSRVAICVSRVPGCNIPTASSEETYEPLSDCT